MLLTKNMQFQFFACYEGFRIGFLGQICRVVMMTMRRRRRMAEVALRAKFAMRLHYLGGYL